MNQQPDKFFRDKLDRYQKPAPASAWDKLDAKLAKKNNTTTSRWFAVAASLLLLAAATFILWPEKKDTDQPATATAREKTPVPDASAPEKTVQPKNDHAGVEQKTSDGNAAPSHKPARKEKERIKMEAPAEQVTVAQVQKEKEPMIMVPEESSDAVIPSDEQPVVTVATSTVKPADQNIKLVFSAEESEGYLDKKALAEATSSEKKSSTLKKLLKKAEDLKNNQDPFGELRQKKNEILALNFKTDKQRGQNK